MEKSPPTRQQLLVLRLRFDAVTKGLDLLKSKREALMKEFFDIVEESVKMREDLTGLLSRSFRSLEISRAINAVALESFAHAAKRKIDLDIKVKNVWGVKVPEIAETTLTRSLEARDISPVGERADVIDTAAGFEKASDLIVRIASKEVMLSRVGEMIKSDTRKINAISEMMLPTMHGKIKYIERVLDEREREEVFRLKRYKSKRRSV